jgi:ribosomal protein S18 acetylase RimI-like enzyme
MQEDTYEIVRLDAEGVEASLASLVDLLADAVDDGASVGFLGPLDRAAAEAYWRRRAGEVGRGSRLLLAALGGGRVLGSVQLAFAEQQNAAHRAEVQRLVVHRDARRRGVGRALMLGLEREAREAGRTLLMLNTRAGDPPEALYLGLGYTLVGTVPDYARNPDGTFNTTSIMYRLLEP